MSPHHIPFPRNFLSLNTPVKKTNVNAPPPSDVVPAATASPESERSAHSFLSNRPIAIPGTSHVPRQSSISSVSSVDTASIASSSPPASEPASSPVLKTSVPAFLPLNTKHAAPPAPPKEMSGDKGGGFLSNRH